MWHGPPSSDERLRRHSLGGGDTPGRPVYLGGPSFDPCGTSPSAGCVPYGRDYHGQLVPFSCPPAPPDHRASWLDLCPALRLRGRAYPPKAIVLVGAGLCSLGERTWRHGRRARHPGTNCRGVDNRLLVSLGRTSRSITADPVVEPVGCVLRIGGVRQPLRYGPAARLVFLDPIAGDTALHSRMSPVAA